MSYLAQRVEAELKQVPTIIGSSKQAIHARLFAEEVARVNYPVLLLGEPGTGKDRVAKAIHENSKSEERHGHFVKVNCAAIPDALFESELFGHTKGAYTGAIIEGRGLFEASQDGTIFLNEIAEISSALQAKLLEVIEDKKYRRVGKTMKEISTARVIAATNVNVTEAVANGKLRSDLFYRLNVLTLTLPPLREHKEDIPELVDYFLKRVDDSKRMAPEAVAVMMQYDWPGNVRELKNTIIRATVHSNGSGMIEPEHVAPYLKLEVGIEPLEQLDQGEPRNFPPLEQYRLNCEKRYFHDLLIMTGGRVSEMARISGIKQNYVYHMVTKHGLSDVRRKAKK